MTDCYYRKRKNIFMSRRTKIMKKRVLAVLLGGCMVAGLLAGCGGSSSSSSSDSSSDSAKSDGDSGKDITSK